MRLYVLAIMNGCSEHPALSWQGWSQRISSRERIGPQQCPEGGPCWGHGQPSRALITLESVGRLHARQTLEEAGLCKGWGCPGIQGCCSASGRESRRTARTWGVGGHCGTFLCWKTPSTRLHMCVALVHDIIKYI